jgi:hypothetical protein
LRLFRFTLAAARGWGCEFLITAYAGTICPKEKEK